MYYFNSVVKLTLSENFWHHYHHHHPHHHHHHHQQKTITLRKKDTKKNRNKLSLRILHTIQLYQFNCNSMFNSSPIQEVIIECLLPFIFNNLEINKSQQIILKRSAQQ